MAKFKIKDRVRIIGKQEVLTVEEIHEIPGGETKYWIQLGTNFVTVSGLRKASLNWRANLDVIACLVGCHQNRTIWIFRRIKPSGYRRSN